MKASLLLFAFGLPVACVSAQQAPPASAPRAKDIKLERHSSFSADSNGRNPFVPIGYQKPVAAVVKVVEIDVRAEMFVVTATLPGNPPLAIINGKDRGIGDRIPLNANGSEFVIVKRIDDGQVTLNHRVKGDIVVPVGRRR